MSLRRIIEQNIHTLDHHSQQCFKKFGNGAEMAISARDLLHDQNSDLVKQSNEDNMRASVRSTVVGKARIMSFEDIIEAQKKARRERR